jgi:TRAP-type mannitol/chloroaromatic compound transport system permease small subunit
MFWKSVSNGIDVINERVGQAVSWLTTILVILVCFDVIVRYIFSDTSAWIMELEWHLFALVFLLGAGYTYKHDKHVRVDLFYTNLSKRDQAWVDLVGNVVFLLPWCLLIIYAASKYAYSSFLIRETSPDPGGLPALYLIKFAVVAGIALLLLQAISKIIQSIYVIIETPNNA